jgi:hypothetical protein
MAHKTQLKGEILMEGSPNLVTVKFVTELSVGEFVQRLEKLLDESALGTIATPENCTVQTTDAPREVL